MTIIKKKIEVDDICIYNTWKGSCPSKYYKKECKVILINGDTITVSFGDSKSYIVSKDELTLIKTPKRKYSEDDPYGEEQWEDKTEYEESKLKDPSRIKKFFQFLNPTSVEDIETLYIRRKINEI